MPRSEDPHWLTQLSQREDRALYGPDYLVTCSGCGRQFRESRQREGELALCPRCARSESE